MAEQGLQVESITVSIDWSGTSPWIRWKTEGRTLHSWRLMSITEHGTMWRPENFRTVEDYPGT